MISSCEQTRNTIEEVRDHFENAEALPKIGDEDYDQHMEDLGLILSEATKAYRNRPITCLMSRSTTQFICNQCEFMIDL